MNKKNFFVLTLIFFIMFIFRFGYTFLEKDYPSNNTTFKDSFEIGRKNYASEKKITSEGLSSKVDQKYEKIGSISSNTNEFEKSEIEIRSLINSTKSIIQFEMNSGLVGSRSLQLGIGVEPDKFDSMITEIKKIGKIISTQVNKTDKTSEFSNLQAKKNSLFKTRESLLALKKISNSKVEELINLENKILEIEESIQNLGVFLGQFNLENEFCTIKFTLLEKGEKASEGIFIKLLKKIKLSIIWTIKYYFLLMFGLSFGFIALLVFIKILEKFSLTREFMDKLK